MKISTVGVISGASSNEAMHCREGFLSTLHFGRTVVLETWRCQMAGPQTTARPTTARPNTARSTNNVFNKGTPIPKVYPLCACGCGKQTDSHSIPIGHPHTRGEALWCATDECAEKVRSKHMSQERRKQLYGIPWSHVGISGKA